MTAPLDLRDAAAEFLEIAGHYIAGGKTNERYKRLAAICEAGNRLCEAASGESVNEFLNAQEAYDRACRGEVVNVPSI